MYPSIRSNYDNEFLEEHRVWCVTEKIHGVNFSFTSDGSSVVPAKRTSFLKNLQSFFSCGNVVEKYIEKIIELYTYLKTEYPKMKYITVFGELFGGYYRGKKSLCKRIQNEIMYCPQQEFFAYDIRIDTIYMNYDKVIEVLTRMKIPYIPILFRGPFVECLEWSTTHNIEQTTIPALFNLEEIEGNIREGHVLKSVEPYYNSKGERMILKNKKK
jgi:Rnl2 family RNA ligase